MISATAPAEKGAIDPRVVAGLWLRHLVSLFFPGLSLAFLWTGPHRWYVAALFILPLVAAHQLDCAARVERRQPEESLPAWPFDLLVYTLAGLQFLVVFELARLFSVQGFFSVDMVMVFLVVGSSSGFSIVTAHELIHRRKPWEQRLGRLLLCSVLYEHFFTEHRRGHHVRVGTPEDPATARFGEAYEAFFRRTVPGQFRSAWRLEATRLGDPDMKLWDRRSLGNRVLHGLVLEWGLAGAVFLAFGGAALFAFVLQAFTAVRQLEAVNYFEHWGLIRSGPRVRHVDSWDTHAWTTYYGLIGLTRHADHHAWPARPFQQLRVVEEAPLLPYGYVGMVDLVVVNNAEYQQLATDELARRRLGPFVEGGAEGASARKALEQAQREEAAPREPGALARTWRRVPLALRRGLLLAGFLLAVTAGVQWETAGAVMGFAARFALNSWIVAAVALAIFVMRRLDARFQHETFAFGVGFAVLVAAGLLGDLLSSGP
jgi:alkane 1-monooxygenase